MVSQKTFQLINVNILCLVHQKLLQMLLFRSMENTLICTPVVSGGCLTGPNHEGVELHGFLSYLINVMFI